jgi:DNA-binding transcriptional MerR regulator/CBS domain-containing protein
MYRIDDLAHRAGVTSRTIRAYQARGLLPPPELRGRTGYYSEEHLHRLRLIDDLQARGFSLAAIRQTLDTWATGGDLGHLLGFEHLLAAPLLDEEPQHTTLAALLERFPEAAAEPALLERSIALGLLEVDTPPEQPDTTPDGGDPEPTVTIPSPMLLDAGEELRRGGVPLAVVLDLVEQLRGDAATIAERFVGLVTDHLLVPLAEGGPDAPDVAQVVRSIERLRPIAVEVLRPFVARAVQDATATKLRENADLLDALATTEPAD